MAHTVSLFIMKRSIVGSLVLLLAVGACRPSGRAKPVAGVGWKLDLPGERLQGGQVVTEPGGREEMLLPALAQATRDWAQACAQNDVGKDQLVNLTLGLSSNGAVSKAEPAVESGLAKCLAAQAARRQLAAVTLPGDTLVRVLLTFAAAPAPANQPPK